MNRQKALRRVATAAVVGVAATVLTLGSASPAMAKDGECNEYREMARISYAQYFEYTANPWTWLGTDLLNAASIRTTAEYWSGQAANSCW